MSATRWRLLRLLTHICLAIYALVFLYSVSANWSSNISGINHSRPCNLPQMSETTQVIGHCNCGGISVTLKHSEVPVPVSLCHCLDCRASGGTLYVDSRSQNYRLLNSEEYCTVLIQTSDSQWIWLSLPQMSKSVEMLLQVYTAPKQHPATKQIDTFVQDADRKAR